MLQFIHFLCTWNISINFHDASSMYMFHLIGLHNRVMYYLVMVIIFMCVILGFILTNIIERVQTYWIILWFMNYTPLCLWCKAKIIYWFTKGLVNSIRLYKLDLKSYDYFLHTNKKIVWVLFTINKFILKR